MGLVTMEETVTERRVTVADSRSFGDRHNPDVIDVQLDVTQEFTSEANANVGVPVSKTKFEPAMVIEVPPVHGPLGGP